MIHELLLSTTETASGSHPCCVVSVTYHRPSYFHGGNTTSNSVGDAKSTQVRQKPCFAGALRRTLRLATPDISPSPRLKHLQKPNAGSGVMSDTLPTSHEYHERNTRADTIPVGSSQEQCVTLR